MARTGSSAVQAVLRPATVGGDYDGSTDLSPYIATATVMVDRVASCATVKGKALSDAELELIERWLAAHLYAMADQTYTSKTTQGASGSFGGQLGMSLEATKYGQNALAVDYSGCLTVISKRQVASFGWLGKPKSEQTDYEDRS